MYYRLLFVIVAFLPAMSLVASGNLSQIVVHLKKERNFTWNYQEADNVVAIEFHKTTPKELEPFERYDERLVKRVIIKDNGSYGSEVKLYLRNRNVRAAVNRFNDPFRIVVDLFDADYQEKRDPLTNLPLAEVPTVTADDKVAGYQLMAPAGNQVYPDSAHDQTTASAAQGDLPAGNGGMRKLLQQAPDLFVNVEDFNTALAGTEKGVGRKWESYPPFIYRLENPDFQLGTTDRNSGVSSLNALSSAEAMAAFAGRQYDFRDENRAYLAYQQVLHKDPSVFERDATHLWKFAEIHLGQENLTLARSYYETLIEKHPGSFLSDFAKLRILDIAAYRALQNNQQAQLPILAAKLEAIRLRNTGELSANVAIRRAFWSQDNAANLSDFSKIPMIGASTRQVLEQHVDHATPGGDALLSKTAFLTHAILLNHYTQPSTTWQKSYGLFAAAFFKRFKKGSPDDYMPALKSQLYTKLNQSLQSLVADNKIVDALENYEALPDSISSINKNEATAFSLAEAYRRMGQMGRAADHYKLAAAKAEPGPEKFKAEFWTSVTAGEFASQLKADKGRADIQIKYQTLARDADRSASSSWNKLRPDEQKQIGVAYQEPFEDAIKGSAQLRTPAKIVLASWGDKLSTNVATGSELQPTDDKTPAQPPGATVLLLTDLSKRFEQMGMRGEQEEARKLLATLKPASFGSDKAAKDAWATQLLDQAEKYRKANRSLDAGRLYTLIGTEAENFEGRAEALYKGGLLLYNAGRKAEAMEAFKKSAEDGNNLYYSNLAKDRLSQLEE
jgi:hypothetical protein